MIEISKFLFLWAWSLQHYIGEDYERFFEQQANRVFLKHSLTINTGSHDNNHSDMAPSCYENF